MVRDLHSRYYSSFFLCGGSKNLATNPVVYDMLALNSFGRRDIFVENRASTRRRKEWFVKELDFFDSLFDPKKREVEGPTLHVAGNITISNRVS